MCIPRTTPGARSMCLTLILCPQGIPTALDPSCVPPQTALHALTCPRSLGPPCTPPAPQKPPPWCVLAPSCPTRFSHEVWVPRAEQGLVCGRHLPSASPHGARRDGEQVRALRGALVPPRQHPHRAQPRSVPPWRHTRASLCVPPAQAVLTCFKAEQLLESTL